jgi:hypothetical protein
MEIEERMKRLESNNRLLAFGIFALLAAVSTLVTVVVVRVWPDYETAQSGKIVRASEFRVVDEQGNDVVRLAKSENGDGYISIYDSKGTKLVSINAIESGGRILTHGRDGERLAIMASGETGGLVATTGANGTKGVALVILDHGGMVATYDSKGTKLVSMGSNSDGEGAVFTYNRAGKVKNWWP